MPSPELHLKERLALIGAGVLAITSFGLGDQDPRTVYAEGPATTPVLTPTPTRFVTPDALATQIAGVRVTGTAESREAEQRKQLLEEERRLAETRATLTAISQRLEDLRNPTNTPTLTPIPTPTRPSAEATARAEATLDQRVVQERAAIQATATARAVQSFTPTPRPAPTFTLTPAGRGGGNEGGFPWDRVLEAIGILGGLYFFRRRIPGIRGLQIPGPHI